MDSNKVKFFSITKKRIQITTVFVSLSVLLAIFYLSTQQVSYSSITQVQIRPIPNENINIDTEIGLATSDKVEEIVVKNHSRKMLISVTQQNSGSEILNFKSKSGTPTLAAEDSNIWASAYIEARKETKIQDIEQQISAVNTRIIQLEENEDAETNQTIKETQLETLQTQISELYIKKELANKSVAEIISKGREPTQRNPLPVLRSILIAVLSGLIAGWLISYMIERNDDTIRTVSDLKEYRKDLIATIPNSKNSIGKSKLYMASLVKPDIPVVQSYKKLSLKINRNKDKEKFTTIQIISPENGSGKTTLAVNLSWIFGQTKKKTVLVDADFRNPQIHSIFGVTLSPGLTEYINNEASLKQVALRVTERSNNLIVIPAGNPPEEITEFLRNQKLVKTIDTLKKQSDYTIIDSTSTKNYEDSIEIASYVDKVLIVIRANKTKYEDLRNLMIDLQRLQIPILGICINNTKETYWPDNLNDQNQINLTTNKINESQKLYTEPSIPKPSMELD